MIGGLILAAGFSSRMKAWKPMLPVNGVPAIRRTVSLLQDCCGEVAVVTGHRREDLSPLLRELGAAEIPNPDYADGMFTSVRAGLRYFAERDAEGVLLLPCDCAAVPVEAVRELVACAAHRQEYALPTWHGKNGHPLWIPARYFEEILTYSGPGGLKGARDLHADTMRKIEMPFAGTVADMDTPEDYAALCALMKDDGLPALAAGRRFFLLRHGATELHSGKVIMGRYEAQLSEIGREQMREAGRRLAAQEPRAAAIVHSPLLRARESARIVGESLPLPLLEEEAFCELSLGAWDGRLIADIQKEYPAEYARRGEYLMGYRFDAESESFYDLQQRVREGLLRLLKNDPSPDIVIVSHAGVIKCLAGLLTGTGIDRAFYTCRPEKGDLTVLTLPPAPAVP